MRTGIGILIALTLASCTTKSYTPKPKAPLMLETPVPTYNLANLKKCTFNISQQAYIEQIAIDSCSNDEPINIYYEQWQVKIYCSYNKITKRTLSEHTDGCRELVERSAGRNESINEKIYENAENKVFASLFLIDENAASPVQFYLTDSISHFFRGAMYYKNKVDADSVKPVTEFIKNDIIELIQSFNWK